MAGFIRGILWGGVVAIGGLTLVSQLVPTQMPMTPEAPVEADPPANQTVAPTAPAEEPATAPAAAGPEVAPEPAIPVEAPAEPPAAVPVPDLPSPEVADAAPDPGTPEGVGVAPVPPGGDEAPAPVVTEPAPLPEPGAQDMAAEPPPAPAEAPVPPPTQAPGEALAEVADAGPRPEASTGPASAPAAQPPQTPLAPEAEAAPALAELPPPPPLTPEEEALLAPDPQPAPSAPPIAPAEPAQSPAPPAPGLSDKAEGVITGRLPRIGDQAETAPEGPGAAAEPAPDPAEDESLPPIRRFARAFENPDQKPVFAILLVDQGQEVNRAELAALDLPLSIVIDPLTEGAVERAALWRAGGQEVVMSAAGLPAGATAGDLEQIFQVLATRMPEAVAVIDADGTEFQGNRQIAAQIVAILAAQGRGLVTFDQGLNAADQVARREGLAAATIFRRFDPDRAEGPAVKRYLDRAVFRAAQEGRVAVIGDLRPETVAGLLEWSVEGRAATVALAPLTALLSR